MTRGEIARERMRVRGETALIRRKTRAIQRLRRIIQVKTTRLNAWNRRLGRVLFLLVCLDVGVWLAGVTR